jgi:hypothetical protein
VFAFFVGLGKEVKLPCTQRKPHFVCLFPHGFCIMRGCMRGK